MVGFVPRRRASNPRPPPNIGFVPRQRGRIPPTITQHWVRSALAACLDGAKAPEYVGKAEFISNRGAARELLGRFDDASLAAAGQFIVQVVDAIEAGFAGRAPLALLLQLDEQGRAAEVRAAVAA